MCNSVTYLAHAIKFSVHNAPIDDAFFGAPQHPIKPRVVFFLPAFRQIDSASAKQMDSAPLGKGGSADCFQGDLLIRRRLRPHDRQPIGAGACAEDDDFVAANDAFEARGHDTD